MPITIRNRWSVPPLLGTRQDLVLGVDKPGPDNTGVYPGINRTSVTGHTPVTGATYENLDILNHVHLPNAALDASPIIYKNCFFRGTAAPPTGFTGLFVATNSQGHAPVICIDCTFDPQTPHLWTSLQVGYGVQYYRCDIARVVDGLSVFRSAAGTTDSPSGSIMEQCYMHDHQWSTHDQHTAVGQSSNADGGHPDCVQLQGMSGTTIRGNYFTGKIDPQYGLNYYGTNDTNSCIIIKPDVGIISNLNIQKNWLGGGSAAMNITNDPPARINTDLGIIKNNIFKNNSRQYTWVALDTIAVDKGTVAAGTANVYEDTGLEITYTRGA